MVKLNGISMREPKYIIAVILVLLSIPAVIYYDVICYNQITEKCKQAGSTTVVRDLRGNPVCLHPGAVLETD